jgi:hypothetical protein
MSLYFRKLESPLQPFEGYNILISERRDLLLLDLIISKLLILLPILACRAWHLEKGDTSSQANFVVVVILTRAV